MMLQAQFEIDKKIKALILAIAEDIKEYTPALRTIEALADLRIAEKKRDDVMEEFSRADQSRTERLLALIERMYDV